MTGYIRSPFLDSGIHLMTPLSFNNTLLWFGDVPYGNLWNGIDYNYVGWDPLPRLLTDTIWDHGYRDSYFALGITSVDQTSLLDVEIPGHKPLNSNYHWASDHRHYGSLLSNFAVLGANPAEARKRFKRDHEVRHFNVNGSANTSYDGVGPIWYEFPYLSEGWLLPGVSTSPTGPAGYGVKLYSRVSAKFPLNTSTSYGNNLISIGGAKAILQRVLETIGDTVTVIGDGYGGRIDLWRNCTDITWKETPDDLVISYTYEIGESDGVNVGVATYNVKFKFDLMVADPVQSIGAFTGSKWLTCRAPESPSSRTGNYYTRVRYETYRVSHSFTNSNGDGVFEGGTYSSERLYNVFHRTGPSNGATVDVIEAQAEIVDAELRFAKYWERQFSDIRPSAFYSTANAMESHLLSLKNNYLESLTELGELVHLAPDLPLLIRALVLWRKDPVASATAFGDFVSDFVLRHGFSWRPNADAVAELTRVGPNLADSLERFSNSRTITVAGKFHFDFPWHPYWGGDMHLEVRSTARIEYADSTFARTILKLDSVGLLPDLHRVWEVLPYSFAVDWVTSVGRRLHDIDSQVKLFSLMQLHWVEHTYRITTPVPPHISATGIDFTDGDLELVYFRRELSRRIPPLRDSKYDFREPAGIANVGVLASLLWQRR